MGVVTSVGASIDSFRESLFSGAGNFGLLRRPGREGDPPFLGAELKDEGLSDFGTTKANRLAMRSTLEGKVALHAVGQAWTDAGLGQRGIDPARIGLVIGGPGSAFREHTLLREHYHSKLQYLKPTYAAACWSTYLVGLISDAFGICGEGLSVGGASAAGTVAVVHAMRQLQCGIVDAAIAVGPLADLSRFELQALRLAGALGSERFADQPDLACRPFDKLSDGLVFGEGCGVVVLERGDAGGQTRQPHAWLAGGALLLQGTHGTSPSTATQQQVIFQTLQQAGLTAREVDYVSTHGTGTPLGDATEVETLRACGLDHAALNATKSITGHCLTGSGTLELIATVAQMQTNRLHTTRNLEQPIDESFNWVRGEPQTCDIQQALSSSFAFGGLNAALAICREEPSQ